MKKRLFLTGPIGVGKSTAIEKALGNQMRQAGGFRTIRKRSAEGKAQGFDLVSMDGKQCRPFLNFTTESTELDLEVFATSGAAFLRQASCAPYAVLDEIGGVELLEPEFVQALEEFLQGDTPCIGVMKGFEPASRLVRRMGLGSAYEYAHRSLYDRLQRDSDTLLLQWRGADQSENFSKIMEWVEEYARE